MIDALDELGEGQRICGMGTSSPQRRERALLSGRRRHAADRPELFSMADDYARGALSQRAAFEAT